MNEEKFSSVWQSVLFAACAIALMAGFAVHYTHFWSFFVDDAAITFSYSRNLAEGYGLVVNRGGETVEGYSNPLWMFLIALFYKLGLDGFTSSKWLGLIFGMGTFPLALGIFTRLLGPEENQTGKSVVIIWGTVFLGLAAGCGSYVGWLASGLENSLWIFLLLLALFLHDREITGAERFPWSAFVLFLVTITRPEGLAYALILISHRFLVRIALDRSVSRRDGLYLALFAAPFGLYQLWRYIQFAYPLPNTYYAKLGGRNALELFLSGKGRGWRYADGFFTEYRYYVLLVPALIGLFSKSILRRRLPLFGFTLFSVFFAIYARGDWMKHYRFMNLAQVGVALLAAAGTFGIYLLITRWLPGKVRIVSAIVIAGMSLGLVGYVFSPYPKLSATQVKKPTARVHVIQRRTTHYRKLMKQADLMETASILEPDMGATSYYSEMETVDIAMLTDVAIAHQKNDRRFMAEYIFEERKPTIMHVREHWARWSRIPKFSEFKRDYIPLPEWRKKKKRKRILGDYVRLDAFRKPFAGGGEAEPLAILRDNLRLQNVEIPYSNWMPGRDVNLKLAWSVKEFGLPGLRFRIEAIGPDGKVFHHRWKPVYGFQSTSRWLPNFVYLENVAFPVPKKAVSGDYKLFVQVMENGELWDGSVPIGEVTIDWDLAVAEALACMQFEEDGRPYCTADDYKRSAAQAGDEFDPQGIAWKKIVDWTEERAVESAESLLKEGKTDQAVEALLAARRIEPRMKPVKRMLKKLARGHYLKGRALQKAGDEPAAFEEFKEALRLYPDNAWHRKRMEETRFSRYE